MIVDQPAPSIHRRLAAAAVALLALVAACGSPAPTAPTPSASAAASAAVSTSASSAPSGVTPTPVPGSAQPASPSAAAAEQTETEWGRIWDAVPADFPRYPGSIPTETGAGPTSATLAVPTDPQTAATHLQAALEAASYSTEAQSGPLEDGSIVINSIGEDPACRVQTRLTPQSGTTLMTVLYGAACPAP